MKYIQQFQVCRKSGVPLVMVETADCKVSIEEVFNSIPDDSRLNQPILIWDMINGIRAGRQQSKVSTNLAAILNDGQDAAIITSNPVECLRRLADPRYGEKLMGSHTFLIGADKIISDASVRQAIWNCRDVFKSLGSTLVILVPIGTRLERDIKDDIVIITHDLPTEKELGDLADGVLKDADVKVDSEMRIKMIDATLGLSGFAAEQVIAMSIDLGKKQVNSDMIWERKKKAIEQTAGLSVWRGGESFSDIGGCDNVKDFYKKLISGHRKPRCVVFIDEIEKAIGTGLDTSGTSQSMLGTMLQFMQDNNVGGVIQIGPAGCAKSAIAKAVGNEAQIPTIQFDLCGMKGSLVGESEAKLRTALATVSAIGQGKILFIATCNAINSLPPELRRRFCLSTFFFDLPTKEERTKIWHIYKGKYSMKKNVTIPSDDGWTGAEIRQCADIADRLGITLEEASCYIVPISRSARDVIQNLRKQADGNFISASKAGVYSIHEGMETVQNTGTGRRFGND